MFKISRDSLHSGLSTHNYLIIFSRRFYGVKHALMLQRESEKRRGTAAQSYEAKLFHSAREMIDRRRKRRAAFVRK